MCRCQYLTSVFSGSKPRTIPSVAAKHTGARAIILGIQDEENVNWTAAYPPTASKRHDSRRLNTRTRQGSTPSASPTSTLHFALPDPELNVSEWADEHRVLSRVSAGEPGRCPSRTSNL